MDITTLVGLIAAAIVAVVAVFSAFLGGEVDRHRRAALLRAATLAALLVTPEEE